MTRLEQGYKLPLLSAPTDTRGYVAVDVLVSRYARYKLNDIEPGNTDMTLALLRLAPEHRAETLATLSKGNEYDNAIRYALGAEHVGDSKSWLWVAAAAARQPYADQPAVAQKHGQGFPDAGICARYRAELKKYGSLALARLSVEPKVDGAVTTMLLPGLFHSATATTDNYGSLCGYDVNMIRWCSTVWPLNQEAFFSHGTTIVDYGQPVFNTPYIAFVEPLLGPHVSIGMMGSWTLALGLVSSDPAVKGVALDAATGAIEQGRLDINRMCDVLSTVIPNSHIPVSRWTKILTELAGVSQFHSTFVRDVISGSLRHDPTDAPRGIGGLIELLYESCVATSSSISDTKTIEYLQGATVGGKFKKFAAKILALS